MVGRSAAALLAGFFTVVVLSLGTDQVLHAIDVYPPWGQPMYDTGLNLLALGYRVAYTIAGGYLTARLAPREAMRHALILGGVGLVLASAGALAASGRNLGPSWYPIALALTALPCAWIGGLVQRRLG